MSDSTLDALIARATATPNAVVIRNVDTTVTARALHQRTLCLAERLVALPPVIAVALRNGTDAIATEIAGYLLGKTLVPLPLFFSSQQLGHILQDSGAGAVVTEAASLDRLRPFGVPAFALDALPVEAVRHHVRNGERLIYTSGTTGQPKGVRLAVAQIMDSARRLIAATGATAADSHFSALPQTLLLEQVCGIHAPILAGGEVQMAPAATEAAFAGEPQALAQCLLLSTATTTVLVPQLLAAVVATMAAAGIRPRALRMVAVGGAAVPPAFANLAWSLGLPVFEGYGLSECCSVVALNRAGDRLAGSVGRPLDGVDVVIEDGEIVVEGPSVMPGYHNGTPLPAPRWRTGDLGAFDEQGRLFVHGRKDNVLVTPLGRNVSPEWIESTLAASPQAPVLVGQQAGGEIVAVLLGTATDAGAISRRAGELPAFARPQRYLTLTPADAVAAGLFGAAGKPNRAALHRWIGRQPEQQT